MEASKCPKCGDEPCFIEQVEKWYCYGCNSYIEEEPEAAPVTPETNTEIPEPGNEKKAMCADCGAELESVGEGKLYCFICEKYPSEGPSKIDAPEPGPAKNDAQDLLDRIIETATVPSIMGPASDTPTTAGQVAQESIKEAAPEPAVELPAVAKLEPKEERPQEIKICTACKQPLKYIEKYDRHYCYGCRKYAPKALDRAKMAAPLEKTHGRKICPSCRRELRYIEKYKEYYCFSCKSYPLRRQRPGTPAKSVPQKHAAFSCPSCGERLRWIEKYQRHYCFACKTYAPKGFGSEHKECPLCHGQMRLVPEYNEWYCYKCRKYSLRPSKPVLLI